VFARVCDAQGTTVPFADDLICFEAGGEGRILASEQVAAGPIHAEAGIATVLIQASNRPGKIKVKATAFGLGGEEIEIISVAPQGPAPLPPA
jgi:beta-galactosidase